jgi:hypothetical protein
LQRGWAAPHGCRWNPLGIEKHGVCVHKEKILENWTTPAPGEGPTLAQLTLNRELPMRTSVVTGSALGVICLLLGGRSIRADDAVTAKEFIVEPATLHCLGFEWRIGGDDNRNAQVAVRYRKAGEAKWREGLPLLRIGDEKVWRSRESLEHWTPRMFAGSILHLEPETEYQCEFQMADPDGVRGDPGRRATVKTRGVPRASAGGRVLHVYPPNHAGPRKEPSFTGLLEAYYGAGLGDWDVVRERPVKPGDAIEVHAGLYKANLRDYVDPHRIPFHGAYVLTIDGAPERPIVIRAAGDGEAIFDGAGAYRLFDVMAADYNYFEGLTIRNTDIAFYAGLKDVLGCSGLVVRNCRLENVGIGVNAQYAGSKNFYIADNVMIGRDDRYRLNGWTQSAGIYGPSPLDSYLGVKVYGQGHVICHNDVRYFHDGICVCTHGSPETLQANKSVAIDIYGNDIRLMVDDFIETDGGTHNIRVFGNRGFDAATNGLSAQPVFGGPVYFFRNILYHVPLGGALKYGGANPAGVLAYHNTFIAENCNAIGVSNAHYRNNLFLGGDRSGRPILRSLTYTSYTTTDYNGYRPNRDSGPQFSWAGPKPGALRNYDLAAHDLRSFDSLKEFSLATGQEAHAVLVDYDTFQDVRPPAADRPHAIYDPEHFDFRLRPGSPAVDAGVRLPTVNDDFTGAAPDLGALELGQPAAVYGPRIGDSGRTRQRP